MNRPRCWSRCAWLPWRLRPGAGEEDRAWQPELPLGALPIHLLRVHCGAVSFKAQMGAAVDAQGILRLVALALAGAKPRDRLVALVEDTIRNLPEPLAAAVCAGADVVRGDLPQFRRRAAMRLPAANRKAAGAHGQRGCGWLKVPAGPRSDGPPETTPPIPTRSKPAGAGPSRDSARIFPLVVSG